MAGFIEALKLNFIKGSALIRIIYINSAVFVLYSLVYLVMYLLGSWGTVNITQWFAIPSNLPSLLIKPWTIITYMFYHEDPLHILFNMLWLFWFGKIFLQYFDNKKIVSIYILGGIIGALFYILAFNLLTVFMQEGSGSIMFGASAAVMAVVFAISLYMPNFRVHMLFFGEVKLVYIALITVAIDLIMLPRGNAGGHIAHLGGAFFGYLWALQYKRGHDISGFFSKFLQSLQSLFPGKNKLKVAHKKPVNDLDYNKRKIEMQKEVDKILDKISKGGYENLTKEEKETLFKMGNKN
jgi:membrane associated rhomboid family serine protease